MATFTTEDNQLIDKWFNDAVKLTKIAGEIVKEGFAQSTKEYRVKVEKWDLVTEFDEKVEKVLIDELRRLYPDHQFLAEESTENKELTDQPTWIIDPIDGTINFIHGNPLICISVALTYKKETVIGIIYNPILNELFTTKKDYGAWLNGERIYASKIDKITESIYAHEITFLRVMGAIGMQNLKRIYRFSTLAPGTRCLGSSALTLAYVARGSIDAYDVHCLKPWDIAAGCLLIQEAGGFVYSENGDPLNIMNPFIVCAGTDALCQELINGIKECENWKINIEKK